MTKKFRTLIIDDEKQSRSSLKELIEISFVPLSIVGEADGVESGLKQIALLSPEIVLLDIQLGDGSGFDLLERSPARDFKVVFITAYDKYALRAFRFSAVDYLLKPVVEEDFRIAIAKIVSESNSGTGEKLLSGLLGNVQNSVPKRIAIQSTDSISLFEIADIVRCQSDGNYTYIHIVGGQKLLSAKPLKEYDELLVPLGFERVHQSHLINMNHLAKYMRSDGGYLVMSDGGNVPLSQRKKGYILELLSNG